MTATDANSTANWNSTTTFEYDGFNRLARIDFPGTTPSSPASQAEVYGYDAASRRTSMQRRGGATVTDAYDALGNVTSETHPTMNGDANIANTWSNLGQLLKTSTTQSSAVFHNFGYDALGRLTTQTSVQGTVTTAYDAAGNRTQLTWPDGFYVTYAHDNTGELTSIREPSSGSTPGLLLETFNYDDLGRRTSLVRSNGTSTSYGWDGISRFLSLTHTLSGSTQTESVTYDASSEVATRNTSNDGWAWTGAYNVNRPYGTNPLNQQTSSGGNTLSWSAPGNLTSDSVTTYGFDSVNRLITTSAGKAAAYDGVGRMWSVGVPGNGTRFLYDGQEVIAEYNVSGTLLRRYVHGPGVDEPLVWYEGANTSQRSHLYADRQGSIVATAGDSGALTGINAYDEYGLPNGALAERFGYTGQKFLSEIGLYDYKARIYSPTLGRFLQPDPTGYGPGMNLYAYAGGDPVDRTDPSGLLDTDLSGITVVGIASPDIYVSNYDFTQTYNFYSGGVYLATEVSEVAVISKRRPPSTSCQPAISIAAKIANVADNISNAATVVGLVSGGAALVSSETIVGGIGFWLVSAGAFTVSTVATAVEAGANFAAGRYVNLGVNLFSLGAGKAVGFAANEVGPAIQLVRNGGAALASQAASSVCPG